MESGSVRWADTRARRNIHIEGGRRGRHRIRDRYRHSTHTRRVSGQITEGAYIDFGDGRRIVDCNGHGTHVAGTIGGATSGVASSVRIVPVKIFSCSGGTTERWLIDGMAWVINHHQSGQPAVANMSLGGSAPRK